MLQCSPEYYSSYMQHCFSPPLKSGCTLAAWFLYLVQSDFKGREKQCCNAALNITVLICSTAALNITVLSYPTFLLYQLLMFKQTKQTKQTKLVKSKTLSPVIILIVLLSFCIRFVCSNVSI